MVEGRCFIFLFLFFSSAAFAGAGDSCLVYTDCASPYPVCVEGFCADCASLGDQTSCEDASSGASVYCSWQIGSCIEYPEIPAPVSLVGILALLTYFLVAFGCNPLKWRPG